MITITDTMRKTWEYLTKYMTEAGAAGIMGNMYAESGIIPNRVEVLCLKRLKEQGKVYTDATYTAFVDDGTISRAQFLNPLPGKQYGYGLCQWTSPSRKAGLYDLCKSEGVSIGDLAAQLDYLMMELKTVYKTTWAAIEHASDIYTATIEFLLHFECPADTGSTIKNLRYGYAKDIYNQLNGGGKDMATTTQKALQWMLDLAADQTHGYSQINRYGPDYDCSSAVITAWVKAGVPVDKSGATYTKNMKDAFLANGFRDVTASCNLATGAGLQAGDVLLNEDGKGTTGNGHTSMYVGNGQIVHARGQSYGSPATGDQGTEIAVTPYYNHPYYVVLRYNGSAQPATQPGRCGNCTVTLGQFLVGSVDPEIKTIQTLLNWRGYKGKNGKALTVDGELGENTAYAIEQLQRKAGMKNINFGTVSTKTWNALLG